jgi:outer membrane protein TolC
MPAEACPGDAKERTIVTRLAAEKWWALSLFLGAEVLATSASAQTAPPRAVPPPVVPPPTSLGPAVQVTFEPVPSELLAVSPGGLTNADVGKRAAETSYNARAQGEAMKSAAARVDEAWAAFLPRLSGVASYTRLSPLMPPNLFGSAPALPNVKLPKNPPEPAFDTFYTNAWVPFYNGLRDASFPIFVNNWLLQATLTVPISDYFLRITQNYSAATQSRDAARFDQIAARANSAADGRVAFYSWLGARGSVIVAVQALNDQKSHLALAKNQFDVGQASKSDVLRAQTNMTNAELQVVHAQNLADLSEKQMRVAMHAKDGETFTPGESLEVNPTPLEGNPRALIDEALSSRMEIRSIDANAAAAREQAKVGVAGELPVVTGVGDAIYANPNQRLIPPVQEWFPTWDVGVRITWSPNDTLTGSANVADLKARARQLEAQKGTIRDNIELEVTQAFQNVREFDVSLTAAKTELESAQEAYRVTKELFNNGRATSTTLTDSETELTRSRLDLLTAQVNARTARVRLEHALGRDVRIAQASSAQ